ncbi:MAG: hypothetical protein V2A61_03515 [Calditrichota bacterium]
MQYKLPDKVEHPHPGWVKYLTPKAFVDSLNSGSYLDIFYLKDIDPVDASNIVYVPGMTTLMLGEFFMMVDTMKTTRPLYLMCLYGDDSRKAAQEAAKRGLNCIYVDGGSYRLSQEMQKNKWTIMPQPWRGSTTKQP